MSGDFPGDILDDLFVGCALAAFLELARASGQMPDQEATRRLAYRYYEEDLKNRQSISNASSHLSSANRRG